MEAERALQDLLLERITADRDLTDRVGELLLAAWEGDAELESALAGERPGRTVERAAKQDRESPPEVYLGAVHVEGFRGVAEPKTLPLRSGPGLTLVTGRNGSGKSSFAEAVELVLTGMSSRWTGRTAVWREGWRNLHSTGSTRIAVDVIVAGSPGLTTISRTWTAADELDGGRWTRQRRGQKIEPFDGRDWGEHLTTHRPFLPYGELGALIDSTPSKLYDALHNLLGLGSLTAAQDRLRSARKAFTDAEKAVGKVRRELREALLAVDGDERAARAAELLRPTAPDLDAIAELAVGDDAAESEIATLQRLAALEVPDVERVSALAGDVRKAVDRMTELAAGNGRDAERVAGLLRLALHHHEETGDQSCPVCGHGLLDDAWRVEAEQRAAELEAGATDVRAARTALDHTVRQARAAAHPVPAALTGPSPVDTAPAHQAWQRWVAAAEIEQPTQLAHALLDAHPPLAEAVGQLRSRVEQELSRRDETWRPLARQLATWHDDAARVRAEAPRLAELQQAEDWLKATAGELRDQRLAPFAAKSQDVWRQLRQQSNVELGPVRLEGTSTRRRAVMDVSVDGAEGGAAIGVMSQGELHALGLSLFLPRATAEDSPFRFLVIDDPVQSMDPAKVDGLARVLAGVAEQHQVVVFTHDDRLPEAVRRLALDATVWEVHRRERSVVELRPGDDPVRRYLADARALASTPELPDDLRGELVASCCRSAIEAACHARIRAVRLARGETHAMVEQTLAAATGTHQVATLAVLDDPARHGDLLGRLRREGEWAVNAFQDCRRGAHVGRNGDLHGLIRDSGKLAAWILK